MISHCDFIEQARVDEGRLRPDMVVNLPGGKKIIVDAKTPLAAYLESLEALEDSQRRFHLEEHARQVRSHIRSLSQRAYWEQFQPTPEFVVMFLPGEAFFSAALEKDPSLIEVGVQERVILATPTTLIALLRAVAFGWRQENIAENARLISDLGKELYKRLDDMNESLHRMGRNIRQVVDGYNQTVGTFERRVLVSARKLNELDSSLKQDALQTPNPLDSTPRSVQSIDIKDSSEG
jgi:DNA recombination protein RmuC